MLSVDNKLRNLLIVLAVLALVVASAAPAAALQVQPASDNRSPAAIAGWPERMLTGSVSLAGQVPLVVSQGTANYVRQHPADALIALNFGFALRDKVALDALIEQGSRTHQYLSRDQLYARFTPPLEQIEALQNWLEAKGFRVTRVGIDRMMVSAVAKTSVVEQALQVKINDYIRPATTFRGLDVAPYQFYANTTAPILPARLGIQSISGLSDVNRFFTQAQIDTGNLNSTPVDADCGDGNDGVLKPLCPDGPNGPNVRSGGYFPADLRGLYNITGHGYDGTGQTIGFTLWTAPERQAAMNAYATATGDVTVTIDSPCTATGNSATVPSSCATQVVAADHLLFILENGNLDSNTNYGSNVETALDIEAAHAVATHVGMKYYASECSATTPAGSGLSSAGCNGSDVGLEMAIEDAANDPTLHSVSNSWAFGGEAEWGAADPFLLAAENSFTLAAAAGTTFYFSTGDSGTYQSGYPSDSAHVVAVGGTSTYATSNPAVWSTSTTWSGGGSWCSNVIARPAWQTGAGVTANAPCPGRVIPDVSAIADSSTGIKVYYTNASGNTGNGQVGGTSLAAPVMNGLQAVTQNFVAAQTYPGPTPALGFTAPVMYQMGNSGNYASYFRDIECGNTASPTSGPDGEAAGKGWDAATGWGEPDWYNYSIGYALTLGATNLSVPPSLSRNFSWTCAKTPSNSTMRGFSFPSTSVGYAVGNASGNTPWYGKFLASGAWGAVNTFFKSTDGGATWFPSNSDMFSIACTSSTTCIEVGAGGRARKTTDSGATWSDVTTAPGNNKPLTQITCPSSSICYAVGDRGNAMKSTDGGSTWSWLASTAANPLYGLSCPSTSVCYATDIYAHILKTSDGGATWTWQQTPITTPGVQVPGSGGPNPFAGLMAISCSDTSTCVASGLYAVVAGQTIPSSDPPIVTTTDGGSNWVRQTSNAGSGNYLHSISCLPGTTTCTAVGRGGRIMTTIDLTTWITATSGTTNMLNSVTCLSTSFCMAVGQNGTVDVWNGTTWTATTGNGGTGMLASVSCLDTNNCYATGKQGVTIATTNGGTSWTQQAGGGTTQQMNSVSCPSASTCYAVGNAGTILKTANGGQTWITQTSGTTQNLSGISCATTTACVTVGAVTAGAATVRYTTDGSTWSAGSSTGANALNGVACTSSTACLAVGATGTIIGSTDGGATWSAKTSGVTVTLNALTCPAGACYATGAVASGAAVILKSTDGGATWSPQTSGTANPLSGIACANASFCVANGTLGTVVMTGNGGTTWTQQGNPLSGPTTALNATNIALLGASCTSDRCVIGTGAQGNIMTAPIRTCIGGNWSASASWLDNLLPAAGDMIVIKGTCTFDNAASKLAYGPLTLGSVSTPGILNWPIAGTNTLSVTAITSAVAGGSIDMTNGGTLGVSAFWDTTNMTFTGGAGTVVFNGVGAQNLTAPAALAFNNLIVNSGAILVEVTPADNVTVGGTLSNNGTIRKSKAVTGTGAVTFGLAGAYNGAALSIDVTTQGTLSNLQVDRIDANHPNATGPGSGLSTMTGRYWNITATGSGTSNLTLPHSIAVDSNTNVCEYTAGPGYGWDCARTSSTANTVTRNGVTAFSPWTVGDKVGPTAITLQDFSAQSANSLPLIASLLALSALALGAIVVMTRMRRQA